MNKKTIALNTVSALLLVAPALTMAKTCFEDGSECSVEDKWYLGFEYGNATTLQDDADINRLRNQLSLENTSFNIDDNGNASGVLLGYQYTENLAFEASYRDFGKRSLSVAPSLDSAGLLNSGVASVFPETGSGVTLGAIASWPLAEHWKLSGKLGLMRWKNDDEVINGNLVTPSTDGTDFWYGVETSYQITEHLQAYLGYTRFHLDDDELDVTGLGLRWFWGGSKGAKQEQRRPQPSSSLSPAQRPATSAAVELDDDSDGVSNSADKCPGTPRTHRVDSNGCTRYQPVNYEYKLAIYYPHDSAVIDSSYMGKIDELVDFAKKHNIKMFRIIGHTSAPGSEAYNQGLSERRAQSLANILIQKYGYQAANIEVVGKGETELAVQGSGEAVDAKNRRLEVDLSASGKKPLTK